ncbi:hypothetical protein SCHPADRAFT_947727 [Schizopora paradoxa]|uniref:Uncharacterized protein n=1 Tax=Schizopora paradoxa TaxID=27342 RepID=A0A0H2QYB0_9AGAM|nr:hypothetical protein SCHPADRAFT_947727 [Schizopora paradoxa]
MPHHVVEQHGKLMLIVNQSFGKHLLNSQIPLHKHSIKLDGMQALGLALCAARAQFPHCQIVVFKSDVKGAYRLIPMSPYWKPLQATKIDGRYHIDRNNSFGGGASGHLFCTFYLLVLWIAKYKQGIDDLLAYIIITAAQGLLP